MELQISGYQVRELFDPVQTHAVYAVPAEQVVVIKQQLKELGATRFRVVKCSYVNLSIVCFKAKAV